MTQKSNKPIGPQNKPKPSAPKIQPDPKLERPAIKMIAPRENKK